MASRLDLIRDPAGIASMTAALEQSLLGMPPVDEFRVANKHFAPILGALRSAKRDDSPAKWETFGRLEIVGRDGGRTNVLLYVAGSPPDSEIALKCEGEEEYYRGGAASDLEKAIRAAAAEPVE